MHIGGTASGRWLRRARDLALEQVPQAEDVAVVDADHWLAVSFAEQVAEAVHAFLQRHPHEQSRC